MLDTLASLVQELKNAGQKFPRLSEMMETNDAELFLVLPRLVWLHFLDQQSAGECRESDKPCGYAASAIVKQLLPHRFTDDYDQQLAHFMELFSTTKQMLDLLPACGEGRHSLLLWNRAVEGGPSQGNEFVSRLEEAMKQRPNVTLAVEEHMRELERWSMELQRHCAGDWNRLSEILLQCLSTESEGTRAEDQKFIV